MVAQTCVSFCTGVTFMLIGPFLAETMTCWPFSLTTHEPPSTSRTRCSSLPCPTRMLSPSNKV